MTQEQSIRRQRGAAKTADQRCTLNPEAKRPRGVRESVAPEPDALVEGRKTGYSAGPVCQYGARMQKRENRVLIWGSLVLCFPNCALAR